MLMPDAEKIIVCSVSDLANKCWRDIDLAEGNLLNNVDQIFLQQNNTNTDTATITSIEYKTTSERCTTWSPSSWSTDVQSSWWSPHTYARTRSAADHLFVLCCRLFLYRIIVDHYLRQGGVMPGVCLFICLFVCLLATSRKSYWSDHYENFTGDASLEVIPVDHDVGIFKNCDRAFSAIWLTPLEEWSDRRVSLS